MFNGLNKAVTFSYDDGVTQDIRLIEMLNRYGLKSTFNINSELLGRQGQLVRENVNVSHNKIAPEDVRRIYSGHEISVHTLTHPDLTRIERDEVIRQVEQDRLNLSELAGYEVVGMAYPGGGVNYSTEVADIIRSCTGVKYSRTTELCSSFDRQENLYCFKPNAHHLDFDRIFDIGRQFIRLKADKPQILYIWGHSYEFDIADTWGKMAEFCKYIGGRSDIFYGTNREILL